VKLPFVKLHGSANDYVLVDAVAREGVEVVGATVPRDSWPALARAVADRRRGVGADGLLVVLPPSPSVAAEARMAMLNPDGSEAEMCGNGLRCLGKFLFDRGRVEREFRIETRGGVVPSRVERTDERGRAAELSVTIGVPDFTRANVPMAPGPKGDAPALDEEFELAGRKLRVSALRLGNPHCVVFVDDVERFPVSGVGAAIEADPRFPQRVNVEFVQRLGKDELAQRTWERGVGETLACGSGATAAAIVARRLHGFGTPVRIHLRGGELSVDWPGEGQPARLRGPAVEVFEGSLEV
jgi:diaminopimelate epimerase